MPATHLIRKVQRGVQTVAYGNPLYNKMLSAGDVPSRLTFTCPDPWPGDAQAGQALTTGQMSMFDGTAGVAMTRAETTLRNLRSVGTDAARACCVRLIEGWLHEFDSWHEREWAPDILGSRIAAWIGFNDFYAPAATPAFERSLTASLYRQWKHLIRVATPGLGGLRGLQTARGLIYGGLNFGDSGARGGSDGDNALGLACDLIQRQLGSEILPDGGHISRNPSIQLHLLRQLVDIRNLLTAAHIRLPESLGATLAAMIPPVKFFRHGDGALALFHGGVEETPLAIDAVLTQAVVRGRVLRRLAATGYEKLIAGRSMLIADTASPGTAAGHTGLLSFEFSAGRERLIVNCGALPGGGADWQAAFAATAAHSTLTIADSNACDAGARAAQAARVTAQRFEDEEGQILDMSHDGYLTRYGIHHHRALKLATDGDSLIGRETMQQVRGDQRPSYAVRWHLHPGVQASLSQDGRTVLLRTRSGAGWRLHVTGATLSIESSVYGGGPIPRRSLQIKAESRVKGPQSVIGWHLARERKA